jgi:tetratricopeptide (TPR) repeat protein
MDTLFSVRDVARLFGLKESRLRYWAQTGFINPTGRREGRRAYSFADLVEVKSAKELLDAGIPLQRVRRNLQALRKAMPEDKKSLLSKLRVRSDGEELMVVEGQAAIEPVSGQLLLDFETEALSREAARVLELAPKRPKEEPPMQQVTGPAPLLCDDDDDIEHESSAYNWFLRGCSLDGDPESVPRAIQAYRKAIELDGSLAAAHTNLGNLLYQQGERSAALTCYQEAIALDPDQPEAIYNLANIYEEEGDLEMAIAEYRRALRSLPEFADAHFNLALALEQVGGRRQAMAHWERFLELTANNQSMNDWRELAERHLNRLEHG